MNAYMKYEFRQSQKKIIKTMIRLGETLVDDSIGIYIYIYIYIWLINLWVQQNSYNTISRDTIGDYSRGTKYNYKTTKGPFRPVLFKLRTPENLNKNGVYIYNI